MTKLRTWMLGCAMLASAVATPAYAGPPYETDDPMPPEPGEFEIYSFVTGEHLSHGTEGEAGFDINYGVVKDLQLTVGIPVGLEDSDTSKRHTGFGDVEVGVKYLFAHETEDEKGVNVAFYPTVTFPTGDHDFTADKVTAFFPLWAQKDMGPWSVFGGGGYTINAGAGNKNFWSGGIAVTRDVAPRLNIGAETYFESRSEVGGKFLAGAGLGLEYELTDHWALLASGGPILNHRSENGKYHFYLSLAFTG